MEIKSVMLKAKISQFIFLPLALISEISRFFLSRLRLSLFHQRHKVIEIVAEPQFNHKIRSRVLVVIAHIASTDEVKSVEKAFSKTDKLSRVIEGLVSSFSHCDLEILISTVAARHIIPYLPEYQRSLISVKEHPNCDPMFVGFKASDAFISRINDFDWFLFMEDDIIVHDSCLLEKLDKFNKNCGNNRAVLLPNRYEIWQGAKTYIDLVNVKWNKFSILEIDQLKFAECENPHSGFYCLSKAQLQIWIESGLLWNNKVTFVSPLESAATGCLFECFLVYKPYLTNLHFLEVRHWDTKYSQIIKNC